ncbi:Rrf2 family transcriptional regulator [Mollicutes bacterium LVI A0039]|nr:Rrf2 family transcriptional regulator [Mollicutes bacterium LVI A0039]
MKISKKSDIAIRVLLYLRNQNYIEPQFVSAHKISSDLDVSYNNIRKIFSILNDLGFTKSKLGQNGGVALAADYNQVSIKALLVVFEEFDSKQSRINCDTCHITPTCRFEHITMQALGNFFNTYQSIFLDDL